MLKLKRMFTLILSGALCAACAFGLGACGNSEGSDDSGDTGDIDVSKLSSDKVDAAGWVAAMTSSDIYNSTATGTESVSYTSSSGETTTDQYYDIALKVDAVEQNEVVTGLINLSVKDKDGSEETEYYLFDGSGIKYYSYSSGSDSEDCYYSDSSDTVDDILGMWYLHFMFADESYFGGDYFNYSEDDGAYVWNYSSSYRYVVKIYDGNVVYAGMFASWESGSDKTVDEAVEVYYTYGDTTVTIPDDIQTKLDALTAE